MGPKLLAQAPLLNINVEEPWVAIIVCSLEGTRFVNY
jgi:hypothetical protein